MTLFSSSPTLGVPICQTCTIYIPYTSHFPSQATTAPVQSQNKAERPRFWGDPAQRSKNGSRGDGPEIGIEVPFQSQMGMGQKDFPNLDGFQIGIDPAICHHLSIGTPRRLRQWSTTFEATAQSTSVFLFGRKRGGGALGGFLKWGYP